MTTERWKNTVRNAGADSESNIHSDHYPVWAEIQMKLKATKKGGKKRKKYRESTKEEIEEINKKMEEEKEVRLAEERKEDRVRRILNRGIEQLKEETPDREKAQQMYSECTKKEREQIIG